MSADQLSALVAALTADPKLAERFAGLTSADEAVALAAELGFTVTADELAAAVAARGRDMSDAELAQAAGGTAFNPTELCGTNYRATCR